MPAYNVQVDLNRIDRTRIQYKQGANGEEKHLYTFVMIIDDNPDEWNNVGEAYERLKKDEYAEGKTGRLLGYCQLIPKLLFRKGSQYFKEKNLLNRVFNERSGV